MSTIASITLDEKSICTIPEVEHEKQQALGDIIVENQFIPPQEIYGKGPYHLHLSILDNRTLSFALSDKNSSKILGNIILRLSSFRKIVRDYFQMFESHFNAIKGHSIAKIETIDMARRALHNEGAEILFNALQQQNVTTNLETARRLFTLICALHFRQEIR